VRRFLLTLALTLGILVLTPGPSWACSCAVATTPEQVQNAVTVAAGTVDWTASDGQTRTYKVDVDSVYKGAAASSEKLLTSAQEASCGLTGLTTGRRYLFFIEGRHPGVMRVGLCGGTTAFDDDVAGQVEAVTGPPGKPLVIPGGGGGDAADEDHSARTLLLGTGTALLLAALGGYVVRRRVGSGPGLPAG
jgi:hypothetical protein